METCVPVFTVRFPQYIRRLHEMNPQGFLDTKRQKDADYAGYLVLFANTLAQAKSMPLSQEQAARGTGLFISIEFMRFNQDDATSLWNNKPLELVDNFI